MFVDIRFGSVTALESTTFPLVWKRWTNGLHNLTTSCFNMSRNTRYESIKNVDSDSIQWFSAAFGCLSGAFSALWGSSVLGCHREGVLPKWTNCSREHLYLHGLGYDMINHDYICITMEHLYSIWTYLYACMYTYLYWIHVYLCVYLSLSIYECLYVSIHVCIYTCVCVSTHTYIWLSSIHVLN